MKLDPNKALTIPSLGGHGYSYYSSSSGASVGVWETDGVESKKFGMAKHTELMVIISGAVTLSSPDGKSETFKAGDVALVPRGAQSKWSSGKIRKFYVTFDYEPTAQRIRSEVAAEAEAFGLLENVSVIRRDRGLSCSKFSDPAGLPCQCSLWSASRSTARGNRCSVPAHCGREAGPGRILEQWLGDAARAAQGIGQQGVFYAGRGGPIRQRATVEA